MSSLNLIRGITFSVMCVFTVSAYGENTQSWTRWPSGENIYEGFVETNEIRFFIIQEESEDEAMGLLERAEFLEITAKGAERYIGGKIQVEKGTKLYLIRAVHGHSSGGYIFYERCRDLFVLHLSAGNTSPNNKSVLIVNLKKELENLYLGANIAE